MGEEEKKEEVVSFYDPAIDAYREISIENAKKMIASAKEVEKIINKAK